METNIDKKVFSDKLKSDLDKCFKLSKQERIMRVIHLVTKQEALGYLEIEETMELACLQSLREINGEFEAIKKEREEYEE